MVRNIPVDVARDLCADVVIVVNLVEEEVKREKLQPATQLLSRSTDVMIEANENLQLHSLTERDIRIDVIMGDITTADFERVPETMPLGEGGSLGMAANWPHSRCLQLPAQGPVHGLQLVAVQSATLNEDIDFGGETYPVTPGGRRVPVRHLRACVRVRLPQARDVRGSRFFWRALHHAYGRTEGEGLHLNGTISADLKEEGSVDLPLPVFGLRAPGACPTTSGSMPARSILRCRSTSTTAACRTIASG